MNSVRLLMKVVNAHGPFDGVYGFSYGGLIVVTDQKLHQVVKALPFSTSNHIQLVLISDNDSVNQCGSRTSTVCRSSNARTSTARTSIIGGGKARSELEHGRGEPFCRVLCNGIGRSIDANEMSFEVLVPSITMTDAEEGVHQHHCTVSDSTNDDDGVNRHRCHNRHDGGTRGKSGDQEGKHGPDQSHG
mmetsp:Transcript_12532/g.22697  ORF Transcript_12532/g.22697 Transcript_12532/m.22697 type:complete len:189 (+) Transcript_12532:377-943(+)